VRYLNPAADHDSPHAEAAMLLAEIYADPASPVRNDSLAFHYFQAAAEKGSPGAFYHCGFMRMNGIGTEKNQQSALEYLSAAAKQGNAEAAFLCGEIEAQAGHPQKSISHYRQAADSNHAGAIRKFSAMAIGGQGMKADPELGIRYLKKLGTRSEISDLEQLAALHESGIGPVKADLPEAIRYYTAAAEKGSVKSQVRLAQIYHAMGQDDKAKQWAQTAAEAKNPEAVLLLAELRKNTSSDLNRQEESLRYLRELADSGNRDAMRKLGLLLYRENKLAEAEKYLKIFEADQEPEMMYLLGDIAVRRTDGKTDYNRAFRLLSRAAEAGLVKALIPLGRLYHRGEGVRQDFRRALVFYRQAAEKQDPEGMFLTGLMFYNGEGISPDYAEAYRWFLQAAEKGNALAMQYLSIMYKEGIGVPKNNQEAARWRRKAAGSKK
ncbi:MAG: sel1 repeat family protein, partial [Lentisphaeria bacterium]|nr:sel1 repeat family protein [Lentisphaeria bacterium]